ncbi:MAG TPA: iron ABC transporter permease [Mycobacteriales bacterium]|nr:iron ABC transporter permease [Mycobacteriales bacterium]
MLDAAAPLATAARSARRAAPVVVAATGLVLVALGALAVGRYSIPIGQTGRILIGQVIPIRHTWTDSQQRVILLVRLPRVSLAALVGGGLAISGAVLQAVFRNPLVNPQILGVSSGASFGGALGLLLGVGTAAQMGGAFAAGMASLAIVYTVSRARSGTPVLLIVLSGVITGAFFSALVALITYLADPYDQLPAIVFWLLGSLAAATQAKVAVAAVPVLLGTAAILLVRWRVNVLSLGDEDAAALGVRPGPLRWLLLTAVAAIVAGAVAVSGVIGWVGLVVPHLVRMWIGPDHRRLLPVSSLAGAAYLIAIDTLARTTSPGEIPLGVLTALIGAPIFFLLLRRNAARIWDDA